MKIVLKNDATERFVYQIRHTTWQGKPHRGFLVFLSEDPSSLSLISEDECSVVDPNMDAYRRRRDSEADYSYVVPEMLDREFCGQLLNPQSDAARTLQSLTYPI